MCINALSPSKVCNDYPMWRVGLIGLGVTLVLKARVTDVCCEDRTKELITRFSCDFLFMIGKWRVDEFEI